MLFVVGILLICLAIRFEQSYHVTQCVGGGACAFAAWALWDGGASEEAAARAGLCALLAWGAALALGALAALAGAARGSGALLAAAVALLALTAVAEAAAAWWGAAHLPQLRVALLQRLERTVRTDYGVLHARTNLIDTIQQGVSDHDRGYSFHPAVVIDFSRTVRRAFPVDL